MKKKSDEINLTVADYNVLEYADEQCRTFFQTNGSFFWEFSWRLCGWMILIMILVSIFRKAVFGDIHVMTLVNSSNMEA